MPSLNKVFLMGNLTRDPDLRFTPAGLGVTTLNLAVNTMVGRDDQGNPKEDVLFVDVIVFGKMAEAVGEYLKKGSPVFVEGRLRYRTWEDKDGSRRSKHEVAANRVQFLSSKGRTESEETSGYTPEDDDVPF